MKAENKGNMRSSRSGCPSSLATISSTKARSARSTARARVCPLQSRIGKKRLRIGAMGYCGETYFARRTMDSSTVGSLARTPGSPRANRVPSYTGREEAAREAAKTVKRVTAGTCIAKTKAVEMRPETSCQRLA